jgi:hypothetical protein
MAKYGAKPLPKPVKDRPGRDHQSCAPKPRGGKK